MNHRAHSSSSDSTHTTYAQANAVTSFFSGRVVDNHVGVESAETESACIPSTVNESRPTWGELGNDRAKKEVGESG